MKEVCADERKISYQSKTIGLEKSRQFCKAINREGLEILEEKTNISWVEYGIL